MLAFTGYAYRASHLFWSHGKWSRCWTFVITGIACSGQCDIAFQEESVDGSKFLDFFFSLGFASCTFFIMDNIVFQKSSIEWNNVRLRMQRTEQSVLGYGTTSP